MPGPGASPLPALASSQERNIEMRTDPTYAEQRRQLQRAIDGQAPAELVEGFTSATARLEALDFASRAPQVGAESPDFELPAQNGDSVRLSALLRGGPVVL